MARLYRDNLTPFEEKGIKKQEEAYKISFAKKAMEYSCDLCCKQNKRIGTCTTCPIKMAHVEALTRIMSFTTSRTTGIATSKTVVKGNVYITQVINY